MRQLAHDDVIVEALSATVSMVRQGAHPRCQLGFGHGNVQVRLARQATKWSGDLPAAPPTLAA
jgi:hypothetical protein